MGAAQCPAMVEVCPAGLAQQRASKSQRGCNVGIARAMFHTVSHDDTGKTVWWAGKVKRKRRGGTETK